MSLSLNVMSCGERSPSVSQALAWKIRSFIEPVTERLSAFENWNVPLAGAMNYRYMNDSPSFSMNSRRELKLRSMRRLSSAMPRP